MYDARYQINLTWIDVAILLAFIAFGVSMGLRSKEVAEKNLEEYFLAGRSLRGWQAGLSMAATQFAADTPLLVTGLIATAGIFSLWRLWIYAVAFLMLGFLLAPSWRKANVITDAELTEVRYGKKPAAFLRGLKAIYLGTVFNCTVLAMVLLAATRIAEPFMHWDQWLPPDAFNMVVSFVKTVGVPITVKHTGDAAMWIASANNLISILCVAAVTTFYSTTGGLRSVIIMDSVQFAIMMIATAAFAWLLVQDAGGIAAIPGKIHALYDGAGAGHGLGPGGITGTQILAFTPTEAKDVTWALLIVFAIQWIAQINADGTGYLAQRSMACKSDKDAKQAAVVFTSAQILLRSLLWLPIGLALLIIFQHDPATIPSGISETAWREGTYIRGMSERMPPGMMGLMLTGMLAALGSTVDTHLNWGSSYWTNDIFKRFICRHWLKKEPDPKLLVWVARCSNITILFLALFIMTQLDSIQTAWQVSLLIGAGTGLTLVLRWIWWRFNAWGEIAAITTSLICVPIIMNLIHDDAVRLLVLTVVATSVAVIVVLIVGPEDREQLKHFYKTAHPPGFWGPIALDLGENFMLPRQRLYRAMLAVFTAALSFFTILTGAGSWMAQSPVPAWWPVPALWVPFLLVLGLGLVPVWWKLAFTDAHDSFEGNAHA